MSPTGLHEAAAEAASLMADREVFAFEWEEKRYWIKRARATGSNLLHRTAWRLSCFPLLVPVTPLSPQDSLRYEAGKLERLHRKGLPVPRVLHREREYIVLEDLGINIRTALEKEPKRHEELFRKTLRLLARLHRAGEYHGASQIRNFVIRGDTLAILDFEENFDETIPIEILWTRDLFLLFFSMSKEHRPFDPFELLELYRDAGGDPEVKKHLLQTVQSLKSLRALLSFSPLRNMLDRDTQALYRLLNSLKER